MTRRATSRAAGVVLLEVVLSLALFFGAALVVLAGLSASLRTAQRVQVEAEAADLAVTLLSEIQMGLVPLVDDGPNDYEYEELAGWSWEITAERFDEVVTEPVLPEFFRVQIAVRHAPSGYTYRLTQLMSEELISGGAEETEADTAEPQGGMP